MVFSERVQHQLTLTRTMQKATEREPGNHLLMRILGSIKNKSLEIGVAHPTHVLHSAFYFYVVKASECVFLPYKDLRWLPDGLFSVSTFRDKFGP